MKLDDLKKKAEKDLHIDNSELDIKSVQLPYITGDWLKILNEEGTAGFDLSSNNIKVYKIHEFHGCYMRRIKLKQVIIPETNLKDAVLSKEQLNKIKIIPVKHFSDIIEHAFIGEGKELLIKTLKGE